MCATALAGVAQLCGVLLPKPKDRGFDSWSRHMPRLWVWSPVRVRARSNRSIFLSHIGISVCLSSSLLHSLKSVSALAGMAQWTECGPVNQRVACSIPSQGTRLGCGPGPRLVVVNGSLLMYLSHIDVSLLLFLPPFPSF